MTKRERDLGERVPVRQPNRAAAQRPADALIGLAAGIVVAYLVGLVYWPAAPAAPFIVGLVLRIGERTAALGVGLQAAACGTFAFVLALAVVFLVF